VNRTENDSGRSNFVHRWLTAEIEDLILSYSDPNLTRNVAKSKRLYIFYADAHSVGESKPRVMKKSVWEKFMEFVVETIALVLFILLCLFTLHAILLLVSDTFRSLGVVFNLRRVYKLRYPPLGHAQNIKMPEPQNETE
jgi:hypothetical protein